MTPRPPGSATVALGQRIRARREHLGLSARQLGEDLSWTPSMVTRIETGQTNITIEQLVRLADALTISPSTLLRGITLASLVGVAD